MDAEGIGGSDLSNGSEGRRRFMYQASQPTLEGAGGAGVWKVDLATLFFDFLTIIRFLNFVMYLKSKAKSSTHRLHSLSPSFGLGDGSFLSLPGIDTRCSLYASSLSISGSGILLRLV
jgi:hypothetical protein